MLLLSPGLFLAPFIFIFIARFPQKRNFGDASEWLWPLAAVALVFQIGGLAQLRAFVRGIHGSLGESIRARGGDPVEQTGVVGLSVILFASCAGFFLTFFGLPLAFLYVAATFSILGMAAWIWWYPRHVSENVAEQTVDDVR